MTRDGVPVVLHDESLSARPTLPRGSRMTRAGRAGFRVSDFDYNEIQDTRRRLVVCRRPMARPRSARSFGTLDHLDAGVGRTLPFRPGDHPHAGRGPQFDERARLAGERRDQVVPGRARRAWSNGCSTSSPQTGTASRVLISSFDHSDVARANRPGREYALGILDSHSAPSYARLRDRARRRRHGPRLGRGARLRVDRLSPQTRRSRRCGPIWSPSLKTARYPAPCLHRQRPRAGEPRGAPGRNWCRWSLHGRSPRARI